MWRWTGYVALVALTAALPGCATMRANSFVQYGVDLSLYRSWNWGLADALPTGDPRLDNNEMFHDRLQEAVEAQMARKGYEQVAGAAADLLFHYHASVTERIVTSDIDRRFNTTCPDPSCDPGVSQFEEGTLIIDAVDARTSRLVWRGWAQDTFAGVVDDQDRLERKVDEAVERILQRFPLARGRPRAVARLEQRP